MKASASRSLAERSNDDEYHRRLAYRVRILPQQLARARARVSALEAQARDFGFHDLLDQPRGSAQL